MEYRFTNHLLEIGVIDRKTENKILLLYKEKCPKYNEFNNIKFNELMTQILITIFDNFNEIQKKFMCFHLPVKFIKLTKIILKQKMKYILIKKILKIKYFLAKYLLRWIKNIHIINKKNNFKENNTNINKYINNFLLNNSHNYNRTYRNNRNNEFIYHTLDNENNNNKTFKDNSKNKNKKNKNNNLNRNINLKSFDYKNINNFIKTNNIIKPNNYISKKNNSNSKIIKNDNFINYDLDNIIINNESNLFDYSNETTNNIISTDSNTIRNKKKDNNNIYNNIDSYNVKTPKIKNTKNLDYIIHKKDKKQIYLNKLKTKNDLLQNILYENNDNIFSPLTKIFRRNNNNNNNDFNYEKNNINENKTNNNFLKTYYSNYFINTPFCENIKQSNNNKFSIYNRLFEDGKNRIKKRKQKIIEQDKYIDNLSNQISGENKKVDYNRINDLYKNKERSKTFEKKRIMIEKEEGLTFKPYINKSEYSKRIYSNFMERNYYNNNNNNNKCLNEYNYNNYYNLYTQKKMDKKQKERIVNTIINKMNGNPLIKNQTNNCNYNTPTKGDNNVKTDTKNDNQ